MNGQTELLCIEHEHLAGLRVNDLVAKVAKVTLKDTTRVLKSLLLVSEFLDIDLKALLNEEYTVGRPSLVEAGKCNQAFDELLEAVRMYDNPRRIAEIRELD